MAFMPVSVPTQTPARAAGPSRALRCRRKFLRFFPGGFRDQTYLDWERSYKWETHKRWREALGEATFRTLLREGRFAEIALKACTSSCTATARSSAGSSAGWKWWPACRASRRAY
jgi:hypothetical protein